MWRCLKFVESFKNGRRVISKEQNIGFVNKILRGLSNHGVPEIENKENFGIKEIDINCQNVIRKVFVPSLFKEEEFNKEITGMVFIEYDQMADSMINSYLLKFKVIHSPVKDDQVEKIIDSLSKKEEKIKFKQGDLIQINEGSYKGTLGRIVSINKDVYKINIQIFGVDQYIDIFEDQISFAEDF